MITREHTLTVQPVNPVVETRKSLPQPADMAGRSNLTPSQFLIWLGQKLIAEAPLYNMVHAFTIAGAIEPARFQAAFQSLLDRSDALRTVIEEIDGVPQQRVRSDFVYPMEYLDFAAEPDLEAHLEAWLAERRTRRLDLEQCLFDTALIKLGPESYVWYLNQHHLITDVLSFTLVYRRMAELYALALADNLAQAPAFPLYQDYLTYLQDAEAAASTAKAAAYWQKKLAHPAEPVAFYGRSLAGQNQAKAQRVPVALGAERSQALRHIAQEKDIRALTPDMSFFHMFSTLLFTTLYRLSGQTRLAIGAPFHNRLKPAFKETIGLFISVYPLQLELEPDETFVSLIKKSMAETFTTLRYAHYQPTDPAYGKAYSVVLNYLTASFGDFNGLPTDNAWLHSGAGDSNHSLRLQVHDFADSGELVLYFDFNCAVFDEIRRQWFIQHFLAILDSFIADRGQPIARVELLSAVEKERLLTGFNETAAPYPGEKTVAHLFAAQAARSPQAIALQAGQQTLTYEQLNRRANQLAHYLIEQGVGSEVLVGLCLERSPEAVIAMLAVLKAGGAYVPLDPAYPPARLAFILEDTGIPVLLSQSQLKSRLPSFQAHTFLLDDENALAAYPDTDPDVPVSPDHLAYVIYTSGSTGVPKGAMIRHRGLTNYIWWAKNYYLQGQALDFPLFSSLSFDLTVTSIYTPLLVGGRIVVYPEQETGDLAILQVIEDNAVDIIKLTPAHLALVKSLNLGQSRLKKMIVGGEDFKRELALNISDRFNGQIELYNEYGPTETVVGCMIHRFDPARDLTASVPIGRPVANTQIYLLDQNLQPVPTGVIGEIVIAGAGVARGYLNRPDLSAARFVADPFRPGATMYRSGDLARWNLAGELEFLGRADHQVKIKGVRIELGEIEAALLDHPAIQTATVAVVHDHKPETDIQHCTRCGLPSNYPDATFDAQGVCHTCRDFEKHQAKVQPYFRTMSDLRQILGRARVKKQGKYDCLVLLSGGKDSTYMLYQLVKELGATPLVFSLDNGYISEGAKTNIRRVTEDLGVDLVWGQTPHMNAIFVDSLKRHSNVCNGCFKTIYTLSVQVAHEHGIRYIVTGLARGQLFETRLTDMFETRVFDTGQIDRTVLEARKAYHRMDDAVSQWLDVSLFQDDAIFEEIQFIDFYRYTDVELDEMYRYLARHAPWIRPADTGRSTNCLINDLGIYIHKKERGYHNYALPYSWDVRLGHKVREAALDELDDDIDEKAVKRILQEIGYPDELQSPARSETRLAAYYVASQPLREAELKTFLGQRLPEAMLPAYFIQLEALPLTRNGKVDRAALPVPQKAGLKKSPTLETDFVPPSTSAEQTLAGIWAEVFRLRQVGIQDNFFDLGGDSIISIQIIAKASQAGLHLTPRQLFQYQTITELAEVAGTVATSRVEQGLVTGAVPLTPIQQWFFSQNLPHPHHWNLALLLEVPPTINVTGLEQALLHLLLHHDALRLRFTRSQAGWQQFNLPAPPATILRRVDLAGLSPAEQEARFNHTVAELEAGHDLSRGKLVGAAYFGYGAGQPGRLFITCHHLAVDGVSWQTLLQDLETAYYQLERGQPPELPPKTTSFKAWAEGLVDYAQSEVLRQELAYWLNVTQSVEAAIPVDGTAPAANTEASARIVSRSLSPADTKALLQQAPAAYNTQINDLLLTALLQALAGWTGRNGLLLSLEGHGREEILEAVDLSRTIGWFTSIFPVALRLPDDPEPGSSLKSVKEQLRRIPNRGIGYGLLRYLCQSPQVGEQLATQPAPQVLFNYLGQFDRVMPDSNLLKLNHELIGSHAPDGLRRHLLDINTFVINGQLRLDWTYSQNIHQRETIERLADGYVAALQALIAHCLAPESGGFTPSDFPLARLNQAELDQFVAHIPDIEDIYPLSSLQQGMLFHTLYAPGSGFYVLQFSGLLPVGIDLAAFETAWQEVVRRHAVLRTRFVWENLAEPLQIVQRTATLSIEHEDWRELSPEAQQERLERYRQDRWRGFDITGVPLTGLVMVRLSDDRYRFIWNFHHILFDRWSMSPILAEVFALYEAIYRQRPWPAKRLHQYHDYIAWVQQQGLSQAEAYWRNLLRGFTQPTPLLQDRDPQRLPGDEANFGRIQFTLPAAESEALVVWGQQERLTLNTIIQGVWALLLSYWSGHDDVIFGSIVPGRPAELPGAQTIVGLFMNTLPARVRIEANTPLLTWLQDHQADQLAMRQFDYTPLIQIQRWSDIAPGRPLFDSVIGVQRATPGQSSLLSLARDFGMGDFDLVDWNSLPLSVAVEVEALVEVVLKYDYHRFEEATGQRMARHFKALLQAVSRNPATTLGGLHQHLGDLDRAERSSHHQQRKKVGAEKLQKLKQKRAIIGGNDA